MHLLLKQFFNLSDEHQLPDDSYSGFSFIEGFGHIKKKRFCDSFFIKKSQHPLIQKLHQEATDSYNEFVTIFNNNFFVNYAHIKKAEPLKSKINVMHQEIEFAFENKNDITMIYHNHFEFNGYNGNKETVVISYYIPMGESKPVRSTVKCELISVPANYNYYSEHAVTYDYDDAYYSNHLIIISYLVEKHSKHIDDQFGGINNFMNDFDNNLKILTMLLF
jgi:hypothetical protein